MSSKLNKESDTSSTKPSNVYPIRAVERVCDILDALQNARQGASLPDISAMRLPTASCNSLMRTGLVIAYSIASMTSGEGPTKISPASCTRRANSAFSARNP